MSRLSAMNNSGRRMPRLALGLSMAMLGLTSLGCDDDPAAPQPPAQSNLRILHFSPDAPGVDVFLQPIFNTHFLKPVEWAVVIGFATVPAISEEITKAYLRWRDRRRRD